LRHGFDDGDRSGFISNVSLGAATMAAAGLLEPAAIMLFATTAGVLGDATAFLTPSERAERDAAAQQVADALGQDRLATLAAQGAELDYEGLAQYVFRVLDHQLDNTAS
jgi:hypothetical protein